MMQTSFNIYTTFRQSVSLTYTVRCTPKQRVLYVCSYSAKHTV